MRQLYCSGRGQAAEEGWARDRGLAWDACIFCHESCDTRGRSQSSSSFTVAAPAAERGSPDEPGDDEAGVPTAGVVGMPGAGAEGHDAAGVGAAAGRPGVPRC